jgi:actin-related protein 2
MVNMSGDVNYDQIIMDNGSGYLKVGFAGDQFPRCTVPSIIGTPELSSGGGDIGGIKLKDIMYGDEANPYRAMLKIEHPIAEGTVKNWETFEGLWNYTFESKLNCDMSDMSSKKILVTEAAMNP